MSAFETMLNLQLSLFAIMLVGFYCRKKNLIDPKTRGALSDLLISVILPCNIISSFDIEVTKQLLESAGLVFIIYMGVQIGSVLLSKIAYPKVERDRKVVLQYATISSNAGFLGNPITYGVFGSEGLLYASIALIPVRIFMWSAGLSLYTKTDSKTVLKNLATHPCVIAVFIGFAVMFAPFELPGFITKTISSIGNCTTAVSMMVIGAILADIDLKSIQWKLLSYYSFVRLIFIPAVVFVILSALHITPMVTGVCTLLSGMPAASMTAILAAKYGANSQFGSQVVFVSTVLSMITIPIMTLFF